tara:strand:- start:3436 stop:4173 length:738 start_codon:yes stop_codon:yes gene_type:complete
MELKSYAAKSHQGPYLQINEDGIDVDLMQKLYMVFDGFGGTNVGDKTVEKLKENIKKFYGKIGGDPDATLPFFYSPKYLLEGNALLNSMHFAHSLLKKENQDKPMHERGGASAMMVAQGDNLITLAATGNISAWYYRRGKLQPLMAPDSMETLASDSHEKSYYTTPLSAFGLFDELHLRVVEYRPCEGDKLIVMTDGAYARLAPDELKYIIEGKSGSDLDRIQEVFHMVNSRGNLDNQTCLLLNF